MDFHDCYNVLADNLPPMTDFYDLEQSIEERYIDLLIDQLHDMAEQAIDEGTLDVLCSI